MAMTKTETPVADPVGPDRRMTGTATAEDKQRNLE